jgi:hypothetical protein
MIISARKSLAHTVYLLFPIIVSHASENNTHHEMSTTKLKWREQVMLLRAAPVLLSWQRNDRCLITYGCVRNIQTNPLFRVAVSSFMSATSSS